MELLSTGSLALLVVGLGLGVALGWFASSARSASRDQGARLRAERAAAELDALRQASADRERATALEREQAATQFRALAAEALAANSEQLLSMTEQRLRTTQVAGQADMERREASVRALVDPLTATLGALRTEVAEAERARLTSTSTLAEQVRAMRETSELLRRETGQLVTALRSSQVRGRWGETQLRRVVESAGMLARVDFVEQSGVHTDDGLLRPDMVVRLAGGKSVVVDAKVPFNAYLEACETDDEQVREQRRADHARAVRRHVDDLARKKYWEQLAPAPEFVVMFVPAEPFLHAALESDAGIVEHAFDRGVVIATPMTLMALLRTVAYAWRQETLAENAQQVLDLGKELHGRLSTLAGHLGQLGRSIEGAATAYNKTLGCLESRVLVSARRFSALGVVDQDIASPATVDPRLSTPSAPELVAGAGLPADDAPGHVELDGKASAHLAWGVRGPAVRDHEPAPTDEPDTLRSLA